MLGVGGVILYFLMCVGWLVVWNIVKNPSPWFWSGFFFFTAFAFLIFPKYKSVKEAHCIVVTRFDGLKEIIVSWRNHRLDVGGKVVEGSPSKRFRIGGLVRIGWFFDKTLRRVYTWLSPPEGEETKPQLHEKEGLDQFYLGDKDYMDELVKAEDSDNLALAVQYVFLLQVETPENAFFSIHDYINTGYKLVQELMRDGIRGIKYSLVLDQDAETERSNKQRIKSDLATAIMEGEKKRIDDLALLYGFRVKSLWILDINLSNEADREKFQEPIMAKLTGMAAVAKSTQEAKKTVIDTKAQVEKQIMLAEAQFKTAENISKANALELETPLTAVLGKVKEGGASLTPDTLKVVMAYLNYQGALKEGKVTVDHKIIEGLPQGGGGSATDIATAIATGKITYDQAMDAVNKSQSGGGKPTMPIQPGPGTQTGAGPGLSAAAQQLVDKASTAGQKYSKKKQQP